MLDDDARRAARKAKAPHLLPEQVKLVVEVTSRSNAAYDRQPTLRHTGATKWTGYAQAGIPNYLLIDRDPRRAKAILYFDPDSESGTYERLRTWEFGESIRLPEPFGVEINTGEWEPWA